MKVRLGLPNAPVNSRAENTLPNAGDDEASLEALIIAVKEHSGTFIVGGGLTMNGVQARRMLAAAERYDATLVVSPSGWQRSLLMMTGNSTIVDTYSSFLRVIRAEKPISIEQWLACWEDHYMIHWPSLGEMVVKDYAEQGEDWRQVARERVFPGMNDKLPAIESAYQNLTQIIGPIEEKVRLTFDFQDAVRYVLYIGIGNGAGWVTKYEGNWAVLFGLEGIVDSGFDPPDRLEGLVAHELGHVVHYTWRDARDLNSGAGPYWQLYVEGFAQYCESMVFPAHSWHMRSASPDDDWLAWCCENQAWLAAEFLRSVDGGQSMRPFFGSWYDLRGRKQTGYFLGHQVISHLVGGTTLREIALLDSGPDLERVMRRVLSHFAAD